MKKLIALMFLASYALAQDYNSALTGAYVDSAALDATRNGQGIFNVLKYGAHGNGSSEDAAHVQAALSACRTAGGGIVYCPPGTYLISTSLDITYTRGITIKGAGPFATKFVFATTGKIGFDFTGSGDCHLEDFSCTASSASSSPNVFIVFARDSISEAGGRTVISGWNTMRHVVIYGPSSGTVCKALVLNYGSETDQYDAVRLCAMNDSCKALAITSVDDLKAHSDYVVSWKGFSSMSDITWNGGTFYGAAPSGKTSPAVGAFIHNAQNVVFTGLWSSCKGKEHVYILSDTSANSVNGVSFSQCRFESYLSTNTTDVINCVMNGGNIHLGSISGFGTADSSFVNCTGGSDILYPGLLAGISTGSKYMLKSTAGATYGGIIDANGCLISVGTNGGMLRTNEGSGRTHTP